MLARHAKSSWGDPTLRDHDRPLNARGHRAAMLVGAALCDLDCIPGVVYSSTSARTRETWERMEPSLGGRPRVEFRHDLYLASTRMVLAAIASAPAAARTLMVLGHNPSTHALAVSLARAGDPAALGRLRGKFPTGGVAVIDLCVDSWADAGDGGELVHFILPRTLE